MMNHVSVQRKKEKKTASWRLILCLTVFGLWLGLLSGCQVKIGGSPDGSQILDSHSFIDDAGNLIKTHAKPKTIVSLSAMHTENLFYLGLGGLIVGVDEGSNFPYDAVAIRHYNLSKDFELEELIAADPDLILITPDMNANQTQLVSQLESGCRKVVSLKPENLSEFDAYITKLAMLVGGEEEARVKLAAYHSQLNRIEARIESMFESKDMGHPTVFVEAAERGYETVYDGSPVDEALDLIQALQLLEDNRRPYQGAETVPFGLDELLARGDEIDHYFTLQGRAGDGSSTIIIYQKEAMKAIKAVRLGQVHELLVPLIDNYTFRYPVGVEGLARQVYGHAYDDFEIDGKGHDEFMTRADMAEILYHVEGLAPFAIIDKNYYEFEKFHHTFGSFVDVSWRDPDFHQIEAVVMKSYIYPIKESEGNGQLVTEAFGRDQVVTRSEIAKFIYTKMEIKAGLTSQIVLDIQDHPDGKIIQKVVDAGYMTLENGKFRPHDPITIEHFKEIMTRLKDRGGYEQVDH